MPVLPASVFNRLSPVLLERLGLTSSGKTKKPAKSNLHVPRLLDDAITITHQPLAITLRIGGVPENFANARYGKAVYQKRHSDPWRKLVGYLATQSLLQASLAPQTAKHPVRRLEIKIVRCAPLFDPDGAYHSMKPVIDALKGLLIYDDSPTYLHLDVDQVRISKKQDQHIEITIRDLDPPAKPPSPPKPRVSKHKARGKPSK